MALRVRFQYQTGSTLGFSIERLVDGTFWDFSSTGSTAQTFCAAPAQQIMPIPEGSGVLLGSYNYTLISTPSTQFSDGDFAIRIHNSNNANETVGILGAVMYAGDDEPDFPSGAGVDPLSETVPGSYASGTAGSAIGEIPTIVSDLASIQSTLASIESDVLKIPTTSGSGVDPLSETVPGSYASGTAGSAIGEIPNLATQLGSIQQAITNLQIQTNVAAPTSIVVIPTGTSVLRQQCGTDSTYMLTLSTIAGASVTGFDSQDVLEAQIWTGPEQPLVASPYVSWMDPSSGTILLAIPNSISSSLIPGIYRLSVNILPFNTNQILLAFSGSIRFTPGISSVAIAPNYCSLSDMLLYAPWIESLQSLDSDSAGFSSERGRARTWFEDLIHRHYRNSGGISRQQQLFIGGGGKNGYRSGMRSPWLIQQLAANTIVMTDEIREANARYAISLVCNAQVGDDNPYRTLGSENYLRASLVASMTTVELDTNNDGFSDVVIDLGISDTLAG